MPKFHPTPIIQDCWSSIGNITFYHRNGQCFWKRKARPVFRGTPAQLDQQQVHLRAISAWQHLSARIQLTAPGVGCDPGKMRSCMAIPAGPIKIGQNTSSREVTYTAATAISGPIQSHIKYRLIDEITGYRNNWKRLPLTSTLPQ